MKRAWTFPVTVTLMLALAATVAWACSIIQFAPSFLLGKTPRLPIGPYLEGELGVVRGEFLHEYLFIAFRHLSGIGFSETELHTLVPKAVAQSSDFGRRASPLERWTDLLEEVHPGAKSDYPWSRVDRPVPGGEWQMYLNCPEDAFRTAAETFQSRAERFGRDSREFALWLDGQETVFANCPGGNSIPEPLPSDVDPLIRADRDYQIASALFYSDRWDEAAARFEEIAGDAGSPWAKWGRYLAARCQLRKGTLEAGPEAVDRAVLEDAARRFREVLDDPTLAHVHASAQGLLAHIAVFLEPAKRMQTLARRLLSAQENPRIRQDWIDFDYLLDRRHGRDLDDDLTTWIAAMRGEGDDARESAFARWRETQSVQWLLAALSLSSGSDPNSAQLLEAAAQVPPRHPGHWTVAYHQLRLLLERGEIELAREGLDEILDDPHLDSADPSRNPFLALRLPLSRNLEEFLRFAPRIPVHYGFRGAGQVPAPYLDETSIQVFNRELPLETLAEIVQRRAALPQGIRRELALAVWVRSHLVSQTSTAEALTPTVAQLWPELGSDLEEMSREADPVSRRFGLIWILLRHPGLQPYVRQSLHRASPLGDIDSLRENWWCTISPSRPMGEAIHLQKQVMGNGDSSISRPKESSQRNDFRFLTDAQQEQARQELAKLFEIPTAPNFLCRETLRWADARPDDPRLPEALHLAVRSSRFGCANQETSDLSRRCFQVLHRRFPNNKWAKATKYWY